MNRTPAIALATLGAVFAGALAGPVALASSSPASFRAQRVCAPPRAGGATCLAVKLVPSSLSAAELTRNAARQRAEAGLGPKRLIEVTTPFKRFLTPQSLHAAYALPDETAASHGQTIAVVDAFDDPTAEADLGVFDKQFGLPACTTANGCFRKLNEEGAPSPLPRTNGGWASEISIDVQMAHSICQSCHVLLVEASSERFEDLGKGVDAAVAAGATVVSNSYGATERTSYLNNFAVHYDHPGVVIAASSGDCGYRNEACVGETTGAEFPADLPDVVAVGGTSLREQGGTWTSKVWREGGSACSALLAAPLWQTSAANFAATGCGAERSIADVAAVGNPQTGVNVYDSTPEGHGSPIGWGVWGGTSVSSPIVAAEFALAGGSHGVADPAATLYAHLGEASSLYDVEKGRNGSCGRTTSCRAVAGFDGPSGVGSPIGLGAFAP